MTKIKLFYSVLTASLLVTITLVVALFVPSNGNTAMADSLEPGGKAALTVEQYKNYLKNYSDTDAQKAGVSSQYIDSAVSGAHDVLVKFNELLPDQQQQVVDKLTEPDLSNLTPDSDATADNTFGVSLLSTKTKTASMNYSWKPVSWLPSILAFHDSVSYQVKGNKVVKTTSDDNYVKYSYNPLVSLTKTGDKRHVTNNLAYTWARWKYTLGVNGNGAHIGNCNLSIWGNASGKLVKYHAFNS